jgi:hypothetical protein
MKAPPEIFGTHVNIERNKIRAQALWFLVKNTVENIIQHMSSDVLFFVFKMHVTAEWRKVSNDQTMDTS